MWKDIDIKLRKQQDGDVMAMENEDAIINSLRNIVQTLQGERRMLPLFAMPMYGLLFEPIDEQTAYKIGSEMLAAINNWDDRVSVQNVHVHADTDNLLYQVTLTFTTRTASTEPQTFTFILQQQG